MYPEAVFGCVAGLVGVCAAVRRYVNRPIAHILTGEQRRALHPPAKPLGPGAQMAAESPAVEVRRQMHQLKDGTQFFSRLITPKGHPPTHVLVFLHGYTSHGDLYVEVMCNLVEKGAAVLIPDLPCHGRSDGLLAYIPDWWAWVDQIWEMLELTLPAAKGLSEEPLKTFAAGISLGGGLVACLASLRPSFFDGVVLMAPMLFVSDDLKPPVIVQQIFRHLLAPLFPTLPVTPTKDMADFDFRVPEQGSRYTRCNPLSMQGLTPRLGTARELGFEFPEWMERKLESFSCPFLVMHGTNDKITDPQLSQRLYDVARAKDKTIKLYDGAYHCELMCCVPGTGKMIGMEWLPEQAAMTQRAMSDVNEWIGARI